MDELFLGIELGLIRRNGQPQGPLQAALVVVPTGITTLIGNNLQAVLTGRY